MAPTPPPRDRSSPPPKAPAPTAAPTAPAAFLSPVSAFNRAREEALEAQRKRMSALPEDRVQRLARRHAARLSGTSTASSTATTAASPALASIHAAKRKLTELDAAMAADARTTSPPVMTKPKKTRTSSPMRRPTPASGTVSRNRPASYGGTSTALSAMALQHHEAQQPRRQSLLTRMTEVKEEETMVMEDEHPAHSPVNRQHAQQPRYLTYHETPPTKTPQADASHELFSRHTDPSVRTPPESTTSSPFRFTDYESSVSSGSPLPTLRTPSTKALDSPASPVQLTPRADDGMVDLGQVATPSKLESVEGDDILSAMMTLSTPRVGRHFPSEHSRTASEEREIQFLRRRRLAAARSRQEPVVTDAMVNSTWDFDDVLEPLAGGGRLRLRVPEDARQARDDAENAKAEAAATNTFIDEDDEDDDETTETKIKNLSRAKSWSWRRFFFYVVIGAVALSAMVVVFPFFVMLFTPPLPYCDSNNSMLAGGESNAVAIIEPLKHAALQPYRDDCRSCPLYGICENGVLTACLFSLELRAGTCVEPQEVQEALDMIALSIEQYVRDQASNQVCGAAMLPSLWEAPSGFTLDRLTAARVVILLSDIKRHVLNSVAKSPYAAALKNFSHEYLFNRTVDFALSSFEKISQVVGGKESDAIIHITTNIAPWSCRARNQLLMNAHLIAGTVAAAVVVALLYRKWRVYKTERALVDRLVKEVRYFLLGRSQRSERFYPANHLRDNLFDTLPGIANGDRKWLRETVWPKVAALVADDSRVCQRIAPIHGRQMVVWEWISSNSPTTKTETKPKRGRSQRKRYSI